MMPWRVAKKIRKAIGTAREGCYTAQQKQAAMDRYDRLKSSRETERWWHQLMGDLTPADRAHILQHTGAAGMALELLVLTPPEMWERPSRELVQSQATEDS